MQRPDLATLACVNADCQHYRRPGQGDLTIRKIYGQERIRLLRCGSCQEEFSERRHTALFNTKVSEAKAESIIDHLDEGCSVRATSRLTKSAKATVARLLKTRGRHAQRFHDQEVKDLIHAPAMFSPFFFCSQATRALYAASIGSRTDWDVASGATRIES
jgi:hypothetical protein